jgi:hypothetical protein
MFCERKDSFYVGDLRWKLFNEVFDKNPQILDLIIEGLLEKKNSQDNVNLVFDRLIHEKIKIFKFNTEFENIFQFSPILLFFIQDQ